jgi:acyl carrier protein
MDSKTILADYIKSEIMRDPSANLNEGEDLINAGILDSLSILQLVGFIEERFGIQVADEDVVYDNFMSVNALEEYLQQQNK